MSKIDSFKSQYPDEFLFLSNNHGSNDFFGSLWSQANKYGKLSDKQIACIHKNMEDKKPKPERPKHPASFSAGDKIEIKNWIAKKLQEELELDWFFRNLIVEEHHAETYKAVQLSVRFDHTLASTCHVCGRPLDDPRSKAIGIGPTCSKRMGFAQMNHASAEVILKLIRIMAEKVGVVGPVWIPKSQVALRDVADVSEGDFLSMMDQLDKFEE